MKHYDAREKTIIMLKSDLLNNSLSANEKEIINAFEIDELADIEKLSALPLDNTLKEKIANLIGQGLKLGVELQKLSQRGIEIIFPPKKFLCDYFKTPPALLFTVGNKQLLDQGAITVVTSHSQFGAVYTPVIFITDRRLDILIGYKDVRNRLSDGSVILVSDHYKVGSNIKTDEAGMMLNSNNIRKKVFISGSRLQVEVPDSVTKSIDLIKRKNIEILIGDSEKGIDSRIIEYLRLSPKYMPVEVFTITQKPRVKVEPEWETYMVQVSSDLKPREKQMAKDRVMADKADWGLAVFKPIAKNRYGVLQVSAGTLRNCIQMLLNHKPVKFFYVVHNKTQVANLKSIEELRDLLKIYQWEELTAAEQEEIMTSKGIQSNELPNAIKYEKISKKFEELLTSELKLQKAELVSSFGDSGTIQSKQLSLFS